MKKLLMFLLIAVLCLSIVACADPVETEPDGTDPTIVDTGDSDTDDGVVDTDPPAETDPPADTDPPSVPDVGADEYWQGIVEGVTPDTNAGSNPFFGLE